jgi:hypothetical protein
VLTSRSTDGGLTWQNPVTTSLSTGTFYDKNWITCDTWSQSPHYGSCYQECGGAGSRSLRSIDGGATWQTSVAVASVSEHNVAGNLRTSPLPSAEVNAGGKVYVAWQDCGFRSGCASNDIVMSTSTDGIAWTPKVRIPIDAVNSGVDHFIPGIAVDRSTSGSSAHLALGYYYYYYYYYYPVASCNTSTCQLTVGFVSSTDGGTTWTQPRKVAGPVSLNWIASTNQGVMVGDYMSTSFAGGNFAFPVFAVAKAPTSGTFDERMYSARFDVTVQPGSLVRVRHERIRFRRHNLPPDFRRAAADSELTVGELARRDRPLQPGS